MLIENTTNVLLLFINSLAFHKMMYIDKYNLNEIAARNIDLSSFKIKKSLNAKLWKDGRLDSRIRLQLMDLADDYIKELDIKWVEPEDIILTGSIANYNWSSYSDIDLHIIMDYSKIYKHTEFVQKFFKMKRELWVEKHEDLRICGFPVEIFVEDKHSENVSTGSYSLYKNEWIIEPVVMKDTDIAKQQVRKISARIINQIDSVERKIKQTKDKVKLEKLLNKSNKIWEKIQLLRKIGLKTEKQELGTGNIVFKVLRRTNYIKKILDIKNLLYDKINSIS